MSLAAKSAFLGCSFVFKRASLHGLRPIFGASRSGLSSRQPLSPHSYQIPKRKQMIHSFATMAPPIEHLCEKLEVPALDDRKYRVIRLPNQLEALLVHDPETDKASAAVNVNVGSFSDAEDMPGLAHAVEHALFMGTEKVCNLGSSASA